MNARLQRERAALEGGRDATRAETGRAETRARELQAGEDRIMTRAEDRMREALSQFVRGLERRTNRPPKVSASQSELLTRTLDAIHRDLNIGAAREDRESDAGYASGDPVHLLAYRQDGTVLADNGDSLLVAVGGLKTVVPKSEVRRAETTKPRNGSGSHDAALDAAQRATVELDVRGKRFVEAQPEVEQWIDAAMLTGHSPLRLIHGKGSGMLGRGLQEYLRAHAAVRNVRYGNEDEGGGGVTIFELR